MPFGIFCSVINCKALVEASSCGLSMSPCLQVTDGYISVLQPASERRRDIREHYGFELTGDRILLEDYLFSEALGDADTCIWRICMYHYVFVICT